MSSNKNPKEVILVNCEELPETICVDTRFITPAAVEKMRNEELLCITNRNGNFDLIRYEDQVASAKTFNPLTKSNTVTVNLQPIPKLNSIASIQQVQHQQIRNVGTIIPFSTALTNLTNKGSSSNILCNSSTEKNVMYTNIIPINNASNFKTLNFNTAILPSPPLGAANTLVNIANVIRNISDQIQQTDISAFNMKSFGTQCNMDDEIEEDEDELELTEDSLQISEMEVENFIKYIKNNSTQHKNCKECLICGEVSKSNKYFYGHMAIHQGPTVLCSKCGITFEHKHLLHQHKCRIAQKLKKAILQCPYYSCSVTAVSLLELYDHINEHNNNRMYKCSACRRGFCTSQEFLRHLLIRVKCYTSARKKRFRVYGLESQRDRLCRARVFTLHTFKKCTTLVKTFLSQRVNKKGVCKICLKSFSNISVYNRHRAMCIAKFRYRLIRKRLK